VLLVRFPDSEDGNILFAISEAVEVAKEKILIAVKTYPVLSGKYTELACTAGFRENGSWIRLYPVPFRLLDHDRRYKKYQWVEVDVARNRGDQRPGSYRVRCNYALFARTATDV
jgi:hypothetical protein